MKIIENRNMIIKMELIVGINNWKIATKFAEK